MRAALGLLLLCLTSAAAAAPETADTSGKPAYLTLVIDDLGQTPSRDSRALALPGPVTLAIMPDTPHAADFARQAHQAGKTVIIHMPMDPATGPFAWHADLPMAELQVRLEAAFKAVPYAVGMNNHEGSRMTSQAEAMAMLMGKLQQRGMFFLDSRTSPKTVAAAKAQDIGLPSLSRDVFLDDVRTPEAIAAQLQTAIRFARKHGTVVIIGHPYPQTMQVLERDLPLLAGQGIKWIPIGEMIAERSNLATAAHGKDGVYHGAAPSNPATHSNKHPAKGSHTRKTAPATPTEPVQPAQPEQPVTPAQPEQPVTPAPPAQPEQSVTPAQPAQPVEPAQRAQPQPAPDATPAQPPASQNTPAPATVPADASQPAIPAQ